MNYMKTGKNKNEDEYNNNDTVVTNSDSRKQRKYSILNVKYLFKIDRDLALDWKIFSPDI